MPEEPPHSGGAAGDGAAGLVMANNETIRSFLLSAAEDRKHLTDELRELASSLFSRSSVPYGSLRSIWSALPPAGRPALRRLFAGADFVFSRPRPREKGDGPDDGVQNSPYELSCLVASLEFNYNPIDILSIKGRQPFSLTGLHVVLIMFTGYLVGFAAFRALFNHSSVMNTAGGILGLVCGMLLETVLFIIRTSNQEMVSSRSVSELKKHL
ncbi:hypothetical protein COCNU_07G003770 [Cocos nucifera]|uniref:Uncharacterized protein n=1 Tax=Cocos nucifera TaxID=13894 RepID=A0A8K0IE77_COCNU|nr:hypothetical protein COCNU_07G003770 [Cocos nucifera]